MNNIDSERLFKALAVIFAIITLIIGASLLLGSNKKTLTEECYPKITGKTWEIRNFHGKDVPAIETSCGWVVMDRKRTGSFFYLAKYVR